MDVFALRDSLIRDYRDYIRSFITIRDPAISDKVDAELARGHLWPEALIQLNPAYALAQTIDELVAADLLHPECSTIFRRDKSEGQPGRPLRLFQHQADAVRKAREGRPYVLTTGTASGKSLSYIIPAVDHVLRRGPGRGIQAIVVYPMNALANSQEKELAKFLCEGYPDRRGPVTFARYTGQEKDAERQRIIQAPPDILLTNYVMLELILTRPDEAGLIRAAQGLRFLVLDELHTYRGRQGSDVALLVRRTRDLLTANDLLCVGTSATVASEGTAAQRAIEVARVATTLFGTQVAAQDIITETLRRVTPERDLATDPAFQQALRHRLSSNHLPSDYAALLADPLSSWIETTFGVCREPGTNALIRARPRPLRGQDDNPGAAVTLAQTLQLPVERCTKAIQDALLGGYQCQTPDGNPAFAFRLHQFLGRGGTIYASLPTESSPRHLTLDAQHYVPGSDRQQVLLPLCFCRECGQEYYSVFSRQQHGTVFTARDPREREDEEGGLAGFLYLSADDPFPTDGDAILARIPDDWIEQGDGEARLRRDRREHLPKPVRLLPDGRLTHNPSQGVAAHFLLSPFRFCLRCTVSEDFRRRNDLPKLSTLAAGGRSTATTILSLSTIHYLRREGSLPAEARKLLSFTDNRQDASLQAGHFNDFIDISLLRAALYRACADAGPQGIRHDALTQRVYDALALPFTDFSAKPDARYSARHDIEFALREVLGYRLYRDLRRGLRITSPNLEQCGLLRFDYRDLDDIAADETLWHHPVLVAAPPTKRADIARVLLDHMRRSLIIQVDYLDRRAQERLVQQSSQSLRAPWALDDAEADPRKMEYAGTLYPRAMRRGQDPGGDLFLSPRGRFGQFLRRPTTFPGAALKLDDVVAITSDLLEALTAGPIQRVSEPRKGADDVPGYRLSASALIWRAGDGQRPFHDVLLVPNPSASGGRTNPYFVDFYRGPALALRNLRAAEHTAQVRAEDRQEREASFSSGALPILYCSPTMELGVDIRQLNVVNLRNVPPTPANYAQRSGRAGRSGQPALVFTYCTTGSPHDQYFFRRPERMVAGYVSPPRLDLLNEDLIRAHAHAIWLKETGQGLRTSLVEILDTSAADLPLFPEVRDQLHSPAPQERARQRTRRAFADLLPRLAETGYPERWLDGLLDHVTADFDAACRRWRDLYRTAREQFERQNRVIADAARAPGDRESAKRLRREAEDQLELLQLSDKASSGQSDFYSYRYFASEGFLPGYNFPRLPISAFIPGRKRRVEVQGEYLSRPRFLAISEFGPKAFVYHEGSRYVITRVNLPADRALSSAARAEDDALTTRAKQCPHCGFLHMLVSGAPGPDLCEHEGCQQPLGPARTNLFRMHNVVTRRRDRITSDEEERFRQGYDIRTGVRFAQVDGRFRCRSAHITASDGETLGELSYGHSATLWRINFGWSRRKKDSQDGFVLDIERGDWRNDDSAADPDDAPAVADATGSGRTLRVIPFVDDRRNCLLFTPHFTIEPAAMAALQAALKSAIQVVYQLEDGELATEPLPSREERRVILFYEASEGGAGVLRHLVEDPTALGRVLRAALEVCHFHPDTLADQGQAPHARERCEAACYDCLMSYYNQLDHTVLDRQALLPHLQRLRDATIVSAPGASPRAQHLEQLLRLCQSDLERRFLRFLKAQRLHLPTQAQPLIAECSTRPDFLYEEARLAVYIDGPLHVHPERARRDAAQQDALEDRGYTVLRLSQDTEEAWQAACATFPSIFGVAG